MQAAIDALTGTWRGPGKGRYPTIEDFAYVEEVTLSPLPGKPILAYTQRTRSPEGESMHAESGFYRFAEKGVVELVIAQPTGIAETHRGTLSGNRLEFHQTGLARTPTAVEVEEVRRSIEVDADILSYTLEMAAVGQHLQFHLHARLERIDP